MTALSKSLQQLLAVNEVSVWDFVPPSKEELTKLTIPQLLSLRDKKIVLGVNNYVVLTIGKPKAAKEGVIKQLLDEFKRVQHMITTNAARSHLEEFSEAQQQFAFYKSPEEHQGIIWRMGLVAPYADYPARILCYAQRLLEPHYAPEWLLVDRDGTAHQTTAPLDPQWLFLAGGDTIRRDNYWLEYRFDVDRYYFKFRPILDKGEASKDASYGYYAVELEYKVSNSFLLKRDDQRHQGYPKVQISHSSAHWTLEEAKLFTRWLAAAVQVSEQMEAFLANPIYWLEILSIG